ncbi:MAG: hypothetical protein GF372_14080, partial [Candidatus Marinimicrobia bacterium]|nr:hypothetical protein [Candidatus Neomarinimicrobiota bacterium]
MKSVYAKKPKIHLLSTKIHKYSLNMAILIFIAASHVLAQVAPSAPAGLNANESDSYIVLDWHVSRDTDIDHYNIYRGTSSNPTTKIAETPYGTEWFRDNNVNNGTTYYYRIRAVDTDGNTSNYSSNVSATPVAGAIPVPDGRRLRTIQEDLYPDNPYLIGTAAKEGLMDNEQGTIVRREFPMVTAVNAFRQYALHPDNSTYDYSGANFWQNEIASAGMKMKLHSPIMPTTSDWAKDASRTSAELLTNLEQYIQAYMNYENDSRIDWVDALSETILENGNWRPGGSAPRDIPWYKIGVESNGVPTYFKETLQEMQTYGPNVKFLWDETFAITNDAIWDKVKDVAVNYIRGTLGLRLDAIGWQGHINNTGWHRNNNGEVTALRNLVQWAHSNNFGFFVSGIDVEISASWQYEVQAKDYKAVLGVLLAERNKGLISYIVWLPDPNSHWKGTSGDATIFDENYAPKPAYYAIQDTLEKVGRGDLAYNIGDGGGDNGGGSDPDQNIVTIDTYSGQNSFTIESETGSTLSNASGIQTPAYGENYSGDFAHDFLEFSVSGFSGTATTVTLTLPDGFTPASVWNYGSTPADGNNHWYEFLYDGTTGAEVNGNIVTLHYVDGGRGDDDLTANGTITTFLGGGDRYIDVNNDGVDDDAQPHVLTVNSLSGSETFLLESPDGTSLNNASGVATPDPGELYFSEFPSDFLTYSLSGVTGSATVTLTLPEGSAPVSFWNHGPTPTNSNDHWYEFLYDGTTGAEISGNIVTLHFADGERGDGDLSANGTITTTGGAGVRYLDMNGDGVDDETQQHVATFSTFTDDSLVLIVSDEG